MALTRFSMGVVLTVLALASDAGAAPGDLDPTFAGDGTVRTQVDGPDVRAWAEGVAVAGDGSVVVAGPLRSDGDIPSDAVLARYLPDGSLDPGFGIGGLVRLEDSTAEAVAIRPTGEIVVCGSVSLESGEGSDAAVFEFDGDGDPIDAFGQGGIATVDEDRHDAFAALALAPDGRIVAAGATRHSNRATTGDAMVSRLGPDGGPDESFAGDGTSTVDLGGGDRAQDLVHYADGRAALAVRSVRARGPQDERYALARFRAGGALDRSFSSDGLRFVPGEGDSGVLALALTSDGRLVAAGEDIVWNGRRTELDMLLMRLRPDGRLDRSFATRGRNGLLHTDLDRGDSPTDLAVEPGGRILMAASTSSSAFGIGRRDFALLRFEPHGRRDRSFGGRGAVTTDLGRADTPNAMALGPGETVVLAGTAYAEEEFGSWWADIALARYGLGASS